MPYTSNSFQLRHAAPDKLLRDDAVECPLDTKMKRASN